MSRLTVQRKAGQCVYVDQVKVAFVHAHDGSRLVINAPGHPEFAISLTDAYPKQIALTVHAHHTVAILRGELKK